MNISQDQQIPQSVFVAFEPPYGYLETGVLKVWGICWSWPEFDIFCFSYTSILIDSVQGESKIGPNESYWSQNYMKVQKSPNSL